MFDPFTLAIIGGAAGGLLNKKDPLKGAVMGAGLGYGGGALASGGLLGAAPAAAPGAAGASSMATSLPAFNPITGTYANASQLPGLTGFTESLKGANAAVKPFTEAAGTAMQVNSMFQDNTPMPVAQSSLPQRTPMDVSGAMYGNNQLAVLQKQRNARRGLMG